MGSIKIKFIILSVIALLNNCYAESFSQYTQNQISEFSNYKSKLDKEFKEYKKAQEEALKEFRNALSKKWPKTEIEFSTPYKWVEYDKKLNSKKAIDYKNNNITMEVICKNDQEAKKKFAHMLNGIFDTDVASAYKHDILEDKIAKKIKQKKYKVVSHEQLIADVVSKKEKDRLKEELNQSKYNFVSYNGKKIYKVTLPLPSDAILKKASKFKPYVLKYSEVEKIPVALIYAIMHSESSFNPMARSYVPAFGLMQIVPRTAGIDSYYYLYKKKKMLPSSYLYDANNNIKIGSAYLHIVYYKYFKNVKDPQSRLYCTIAAYNTGAGNVARAFTGKTNVNRAALLINKMNSKEVYKRLLTHLPYDETKHYLKKVTKRVAQYQNIEKGV